MDMIFRNVPLKSSVFFVLVQCWRVQHFSNQIKWSKQHVLIWISYSFPKTKQPFDFTVQRNGNNAECDPLWKTYSWCQHYKEKRCLCLNDRIKSSLFFKRCLLVFPQKLEYFFFYFLTNLHLSSPIICHFTGNINIKNFGFNLNIWELNNFSHQGLQS